MPSATLEVLVFWIATYALLRYAVPPLTDLYLRHNRFGLDE